MGLLSRISSSIESDITSSFRGVKDAVNNFINPAVATWSNQEMRTRIRVPDDYFTSGSAEGLENAERTRRYAAENREIERRNNAPEGTLQDVTWETPPGPTEFLKSHGGIIFPYTPTISLEHKAEYSPQNILHSNFQQYFYKNSAVGPISVAGKFTVQDQYEGAMLLSTIHMLRVLTKMRFGNDPQAGAPPPVCRFDAYGDSMFQNVPVAVMSWRHELPDNVDFISITSWPELFGNTMVPVYSTITVDLAVLYSRREQLDYNVPAWISGGLKGRGFL